MRVMATQFSLQDSALDIYFAGCLKPTCKGCHNPEAQDVNAGTYYTPTNLYHSLDKKINQNKELIKNFRLFGGEPLDQPIEELKTFVTHISTYNLPIWLFTRYEIYDIPFSVRMMFDYIKTGRYIEDAPSNHNMYGVTLASANQKVLKKGLEY